MLNFIISSLNRYFCGYLLFWFLTCLGVVLAIVSLFEMAELLRRTMSHTNVSLSLIGEMVLLKTPQHIEMLLPFVSFGASVLCLFRLNQTQEMTAAKAAGISIWQIMTGFSVTILGLGMIYLSLLNPLGAAMTARLIQLEEKVFNNAGNLLEISANGLWLRECTQNNQAIFHAESFDLTHNQFLRVSFYDFNLQGLYVGRYEANTVTLEKEKWKLEEGTYWNQKNLSQNFKVLWRPTELTLSRIQESYAAPETISFWKIQNYIEILEKAGLSNTRYRLYWHSQISKIGLMISMVFLAATFCLHPVRYRAASYLIALGLLSSFIIHFTSDIIYALGLAGKVPLLLAAWIPALVTFMLSVTFLLHQEGV